MPEELTAREKQVVGLVIRGRTNSEVANALRISDKTVEWNLTKVYRKLAVRSRTELTARLAARQRAR
jgi:DNA-binding CsgD family transcriptional regulator